MIKSNWSNLGWVYIQIAESSLSSYNLLQDQLFRRHNGLTRVSSIRFLQFENKRVLVYNSTIFYLTDLFILYIFIQNVYADKKVVM